MNKLLNSLSEAGQAAVLVGGSVAVLPFGGRVIGVFPDARTNLLWTNEALLTPDSARRHFASDGWINSGGDRTWISPEFDTHVKNLDTPEEEYVVQRGIDPGSYRVSAQDADSVTLGAGMEVVFYGSGRTVRLEVTKRIASITPDVQFPDRVQAAGYSTETKITSSSPGAATLRPSAWLIAQVPGGGRMLIPVKPGAMVKDFMGSPVFESRPGVIEAQVATDVSFKFGVHVSSCTGTMMYVREVGDRSSLLVRRFSVDTEAPYRDAPFKDRDSTGYIQQFYIDDGGFGGFGEMEYHTPPVGWKGGVRDRCETWGFIGPSASIDRLAREMVSDAR